MRQAIAVLVLAAAELHALPVIGAKAAADRIAIVSPLQGAVFPRDFAPPIFRWSDSGGARWRVAIELVDGTSVGGEFDTREWRPSPAQWERIKAKSIDNPARLSVQRIGPVSTNEESAESVSFTTSRDPVGAPIFYREVPLPVAFAMDNKPLLKWKVGDVSSNEPPRTVLSGMKTCANCHSFTPDGKTLAMDVDFGSDKSTYAITAIGSSAAIGREQLISWNEYRREDGEPTLGFLSQVSPDGRYVVSTVKETIVLHFLSDPFMSQIFFPVRGILAVYDRKEKSFRGLPGASDPSLVQTNSAFSTDGKWLVFARAKAPDLPRHGTAIDPDAQLSVAADYESGRKKIQYELYRLPFDDGRGGTPEPLPGASGNGRSNFFPRFSPDGRWMVFCQADSMMLNRPDSELLIAPSKGGPPRRLRCNAPGRMNSWHSFSPNGRWLVYASKRSGDLTQMWLTHIDANGEDTVPVMLDGFVAPGRAANLPEFVRLGRGDLDAIVIADEIRNSNAALPTSPR